MFTLGTNSLGIGIAINLRNHFTAKARAITQQFQQLHANAKKVEADNLRAARRIGVGMVLAGGALTAGMYKSLRTYADFEHIMKSIELTTNSNVETMRKFDAMATKLGTNTIFSPSEIASGMEYLIKGGFKANQVLGGTIQAATYLGAALDHAVAGKGGTGDKLAHIMHGFGVGPKGAMAVADMLTKTSIASSSDLDDLHEALRYVSSTAVDLNITLPETLAMLAKLSNAGLRGGIGGRSLNNMLLQTARAIGSFSTPKQAAILKGMGIDPSDLKDSSGNLKSIVQVLAVLDKKLAHMTPIDRVSALSALMNVRGARAVGPLLRDSGIGDPFHILLKDIQNATGTAEHIALGRMETLWGSFERLKDTVWNFFKTIGEVLKPVAKPFIDMMIGALNAVTRFARSPIGKPFVILVAVIGVALVVMGSFLVLFTSIRLLTIMSTVSFANMGRSLAMAWNTGTAAALRYMTTARGAMMVNTPFGPRWKNLTTGRFQAGPKGMTMAGGAAGGSWLSKTGSFITSLFRAGGALDWVTKILKGFGGVALGVVSMLGLIMGFKNVLKLIVLGLGTLLNSVIFAGQAIWSVISNLLTPWNMGADLSKNKERFMQSQKNMYHSLGFTPGGLSDMKKPTDDRTIKGLHDPFSPEQMMYREGIKKQINLNLNGQKVGEILEEERQKKIWQELQAIPN